MLFDPDGDKTIEEVIQWEWEHTFSEALKVSILELAEASGRTWFDIVCEGMELVLTDPALRRQMEARLNFRAAPFGIDPLVQGEH